jgi:hypothetical protein
MKPGDIKVLFSNPVNNSAKSVPMQVQLISKKGDVKDLWTVKYLATGEVAIAFVHESEAVPEKPDLWVIRGGKSNGKDYA